MPMLIELEMKPELEADISFGFLFRGLYAMIAYYL